MIDGLDLWHNNKPVLGNRTWRLVFHNPGLPIRGYEDSLSVSRGPTRLGNEGGSKFSQQIIKNHALRKHRFVINFFYCNFSKNTSASARFKYFQVFWVRLY